MNNREGKEIRLRPIGIIGKTDREDVMKITVYPEYAEGLDGIEELDYIYILYWMNRPSENDRKILKVHPKGDVSP